MPGPGGSAPGGSRGVPGGDFSDGHCCGRYASYWNAFLLMLLLNRLVSLFTE